jgi:mismatch-specific thymine-DNA glycosylase
VELQPLPDILKPDLKILFVGTNPGQRSAQLGHYFAGRGNAFWSLMYKSGLTDILLRTEQDTSLLGYGYGLTDVVKRPSRSTTEIRREYARGAKKRLDRIVRKNNPKMVAFIGKTGYRYYLGDMTIVLKYGLQQDLFGSKVFLLPSTSGASYADTNELLHFSICVDSEWCCNPACYFFETIPIL